MTMQRRHFELIAEVLNGEFHHTACGQDQRDMVRSVAERFAHELARTNPFQPGTLPPCVWGGGMTAWRFEVRTPTGDVWNYDNEHEAKGRAARYNQHVPRGGRFATVHTLPRYVPVKGPEGK